MSQLQLSVLLSLVCVALLALAGRRPYVDEFRGRVRRVTAALLLIAILALAVFYPVTSFGKAEDIDPETIWFPTLLMGHYILTAFLLLWWRLRGDVGLGEFLHVSSDRLVEKVRRGVDRRVRWLADHGDGYRSGGRALQLERGFPHSRRDPAGDGVACRAADRLQADHRRGGDDG